MSKLPEQKKCPLCGGGISEKRPVWLLRFPSNQIMGPYHAGCAAKLSLLYAKNERVADQGATIYGRVVEKSPEDELEESK
jgi:hypothetical protein